MKRLYVLRHAKSSWDDDGLADHERPLNDRGQTAAPFMGRLMRERGFIPDAVFSSPATRARETAKLACEAAEIKQPIKFDERIYEAGASTLAKVVSETDPKAGSAMIVGHNPGMEGLIRFLTGEAAAMPTAALAVIDLEIDDWAEISSGCGRLVKVLRPKTVGYLT